MSGHLWQCFIEDDLDEFRQSLALARISSGARQGGNVSAKFNNPMSGSSSSPRAIRSHRHGSWTSSTPPSSKTSSNIAGILSRTDVNARDSFGRTLLHHIASSPLESAASFAAALLATNSVNLYIQDAENGWTALHRALYFGNISVARALMAIDLQYVKGSASSAIGQHIGGLISVKDHEGNGPFDVYNASTASRTISTSSETMHIGANELTADTNSETSDQDTEATHMHLPEIAPSLKQHGDEQHGDEIFAFGSNKNLSLGLGDEDDRQHPEKAILSRPLHLLHRLQKEASIQDKNGTTHIEIDDSRSSSDALAEIPALIRHSTPIIHDVAMAKFSTAILTDDPESNLFISGFGPGGRLGLGDESTRFHFQVVDKGYLSGKKVTGIVLGQDHSIAIVDECEVCSWGSNKYGQLGYNLAGTPQPTAEGSQLLPRRIFGPLKKERVIGAAASAIHTIVSTASGSLFTFGKNEGQLGLMDADSRSLEVQITPRRVGASLFVAPISMVGAINRASICLLESKEVLVFTHYGFSKINFISDGLSNTMSRDFALRPARFISPRYKESKNEIVKIIAGGNVIGAISSFGEVFNLSVGPTPDPNSDRASTTNPTKIRNSLPHPCRVWAGKKTHMKARDAAIDQDESIIICTESGLLWKRQRRPKIQLTKGKSRLDRRSRDFKFARVTGLTRAVSVRSNAFGAFTTIRKDCDVMKDQTINPQSLWKDISSLLPFRGLHTDDGIPPDSSIDLASIKRAIIEAQNIESDLSQLFRTNANAKTSGQTIWMKTSTSTAAIPVHEFLLVGRSEMLRAAFNDFRLEYYFGIPETLSIEYGTAGEVILNFTGIALLTLLGIIYYIYTDAVLDVWHWSKNSPARMMEWKQVRLEILKVAGLLKLPQLERAARLQTEPIKTMNTDMESAFADPAFANAGDLLLDLHGKTIRTHSAVVQLRCPFFEGLLAGSSGARWLAERRSNPGPNHATDPVRVDLRHLRPEHFQLVLRFLYCDSGFELFGQICVEDLDEFLDFIIDVMAIADEMMLDRLAQICQSLLGRFVNPRNACHLLNAIAPCSVRGFKTAALEYICLNLETMLQNRYLEDLDEDLLLELDKVVRQNQIACLPLARGGKSEAELFETYPDLNAKIARNRQSRADYMQIQNRAEDELREKHSASVEKQTQMTTNEDDRLRRLPNESPIAISTFTAQSHGELIFQMDDDQAGDVPSPGNRRQPTAALKAATQPNVTYATRPPAHVLSSREDNKSKSFADDDEPDPLGAIGHAHIEPADSSLGGAQPNWPQKWPSEIKVDMRGILAESSRAVAPAIPSSKPESTPGGSFKISQKERKKQLQQQQLISTSTRNVAQTIPWQVPNHGGLTSGVEISSSAAHASYLHPVPKSRPPMTVRQTISGKAPVTRNFPPSEDRGGLVVDQNTDSSSSGTPKPVTPHSVRSVRHLPPPSAMSAHSVQLPLADILFQQQSEKDAIQEAAASKRSLQEIQQEQEFQEWWDAESQRVMAEAATDAQSRVSQGHGKGRERRGRGAGRGRGKVTLHAVDGRRNPPNSLK